MKMDSQARSKAAAATLAIAITAVSLQPAAIGQDYRPGDPINFGGAHKPMFQPKASAPAMVPQASAPQPDNASVNGAVPNNFLNTRTIPWRTGDPVTFGGAHKPYSPDDNKPPQAAPSIPVAPVAQSMPAFGAAAVQPGATQGYAPATDGPQDLQARPGTMAPPSFGQPAYAQAPTFSQPGVQPNSKQPAVSHKQKAPKPVKPPKQSAPPQNANQASTINGAGTAPGNGNIFTHFWHFIFGGTSK